jgi:hypothetical protein
MGVQILKGNTSSQIQDKASLITTAQSQAESLSGLKENEKDLYAQTVTSLRDTLKSLYVSNPVGSFIIPLNFSFTLDGIEGFIFGNSITCNYLPSIYRDKNTARCGFTVTKVHHSIQRNDWTTTIDTCFRVFYTGIKQENKSINGITQNNTFTENTYTIPSIDQTIAIASGHPGLPTTKTSSSNTKTLSLSSAIPENSNIKLSSAIPGNSK